MDVACLFGRTGCGGRAGAGVYAQGVAHADLPGVPGCQLAGLLINTSRARRRDEIFVAGGVEHVGVALTQPSSGEGGLESYASFVPHECGEAGVYVLILSDANTNSSTTTTTRVLF